MSLLAELILEPLLMLVFWVVLFPAVWLVSTPVILIAALFQSRGYYDALCQMYSAVTQFWIDYATAVF